MRKLSKRESKRIAFDVLLFAIFAGVALFIAWFGYRALKGGDVRQYLSALLAIVSTVVATMLGLTVATYTFLQGDLRNLKGEKPYLAESIADLQRTSRAQLKLLSWLSAISFGLSICFIVYNECASGAPYASLGDAASWVYYVKFFLLYCAVPFFGLYTIISMVRFNVEMLEYNNAFVRQAGDKERLEKDRFSSSFKPGEQEWWQGVRVVELLFDRIVHNHENAASAFPEVDGASIVLHSRSEYYKGVSERDCVEPVVSLQESPDDQDGRKQTRHEAFIEGYHSLISLRNAMIILKENDEEIDEQLAEGQKRLDEVRGSLIASYLEKEDLSHLSLEWADLDDANLKGAIFTGSNFNFASLGGAQCQDANFAKCYLGHIYMCDGDDPDRKGKLRICNSDGKPANFGGAQFNEAILGDMTLSAQGVREECLDKNGRLDWSNTSFVDARLSKASWDGVSFLKANFFHAQAFGAQIANCLFESANFDSAILADSVAKGSNFEKATFDDASFVGARLDRCKFSKANLNATNFADAKIIGCNFEYAYCVNAVFRTAVFKTSEIESEEKRTRFVKAMLTDTDFTDTQLMGVMIDECLARSCVFISSVGEDMIVRDSSFENSVFTDTRWTGGLFVGIRFKDAAFLACDFSDCDYDNVSFEDAVFRQRSRIADESDVAAYFADARFDNVSFRNAVGLEASFFRRARLTNVDFRGTGMTERALSKCHAVFSECAFDR